MRERQNRGGNTRANPINVLPPSARIPATRNRRRKQRQTKHRNPLAYFSTIPPKRAFPLSPLKEPEALTEFFDMRPWVSRRIKALSAVDIHSARLQFICSRSDDASCGRFSGGCFGGLFPRVAGRSRRGVRGPGR